MITLDLQDQLLEGERLNSLGVELEFIPDTIPCDCIDGEVIREVYIANQGYADIPVTCPRCNGNAYLEVELCSWCGKQEDECRCAEGGELRSLTEADSERRERMA